MIFRVCLLMPVSAKPALSPRLTAGAIALQSTIVERMLNDGGSQICHGTEGPGREPRSLCRGARDRMLELFCRIGFIEAATDECWQKKREEVTV
jgi:hypothetical protein